jgi:hypothetical protein
VTCGALVLAWLLFLASKTFKSTKAWINHVFVLVIWILGQPETALHTQTKTVLVAYGLERKTQNHRICYDLRQVNVLAINC